MTHTRWAASALVAALSLCWGACGSSTTPGGELASTPRPMAIELVHFDPLGIQSSPETTPLPAAASGVGVTVSPLENITHGFSSGSNANRRPVLMGVGPLDVATSFYLSFTITPDQAGLGVFLTTLSYTYQSYSVGATGTISLRTSADGFASTVDSKPWTGGTAPAIVPLTFDATSVPFMTGPLEVRLYMHDLVGGLPIGGGFPALVDWADLESTAGGAGGDGLRVFGNVHTN